MKGIKLFIVGFAFFVPCIIRTMSLNAAGLNPRFIQDIVDLNWKTDIQPLIENIICVSFHKDIRGFNLRFSRECEKGASLSLSPIQEEIISMVYELRTIFILLTKTLAIPPGGPQKIRMGYGYPLEGGKWGSPLLQIEQVGKKEKAFNKEDASLLKKIYCERFFSSPIVLRILMPAIHLALENKGGNCPDCPGPKSWTKRRDITLDEIMPYILTHFRPISLADNKGEVEMEVVDINALPFDDPTFDLDLSAASIILVENNINIQNPVSLILQEAMERIKREMKDKSVKDKIEFLRTFLAEKLSNSWGFRSALLANKELLQKIGFYVSL